MKESYIEVPGGKVFYTLYENPVKTAPCLVLTHGLCADSRMFEKQVETLQEHFTLITWDIPLHGKSRPFENFTYKASALALKAILDKENIQKTFLLGMSLGGYPVQAFIELFPQMALGFIALDTSPFGLEYYSKSDIFWIKVATPSFKPLSEKSIKAWTAKGNSCTPYGQNLLSQILQGLTKGEIIQQMEIAYGVFIRENHDITINCPVLLLLGDRDKTGKVSAYNRLWAQKCGYPLHIIKNAAHFSNGDNPQQVNEEIITFINSLL